ncbi:hypothetical protein PybrP1_005941 [[Pythium] brassicae (nom. inval.)]|nr:hypothetical protein PybrP1_005941 [[Pythium] brassicae (nom. inval.)]
MNARSVELAEGVVTPTYVRQGLEALRAREQLLTTLLAQRRVPDVGWDDASVELALAVLAAMDSNNFGFPRTSGGGGATRAGAGEREARVFSPLVARRHFRLCHGVGRSGDVAAEQPKAAGSSLIVQLANALAKDILRDAGLRLARAALVLPVATGMSLALVLLTLREQRPDARFVLWPRIDQKSCLKAILTAGLTPVVLELARDADSEQLRTDMDAMRAAVATHGADSILAVLSTTSCFAPRGFDRVDDIARLCAAHGVPHVVNNAYGVQSSKCAHLVNEAMRVGRVDAVVQSLDKNFLVPVGGAVVCSPDTDIVARVARLYPGRASITPTLDFFITMLQMGRTGFRELLQERKTLAKYLVAQLELVAHEFGERVLRVPFNDISFAMSLSSLSSGDADSATTARQLTFFGAMLFSRGVSGTRVVSCHGSKTIGAFTFEAYGAHSDAFRTPYLTVACAIGMTRAEVDVLAKKLRATLREWKAKHAPAPHSNEQDAVGVAQ